MKRVTPRRSFSVRERTGKRRRERFAGTKKPAPLWNSSRFRLGCIRTRSRMGLGTIFMPRTLRGSVPTTGWICPLGCPSELGGVGWLGEGTPQRSWSAWEWVCVPSYSADGAESDGEEGRWVVMIMFGCVKWWFMNWIVYA